MLHFTNNIEICISLFSTFIHPIRFLFNLPQILRLQDSTLAAADALHPAEADTEAPPMCKTSTRETLQEHRVLTPFHRVVGNPTYEKTQLDTKFVLFIIHMYKSCDYL